MCLYASGGWSIPRRCAVDWKLTCFEACMSGVVPDRRWINCIPSTVKSGIETLTVCDPVDFFEVFEVAISFTCLEKSSLLFLMEDLVKFGINFYLCFILHMKKLWKCCLKNNVSQFHLLIVHLNLIISMIYPKFFYIKNSFNYQFIFRMLFFFNINW